VWEGVGATVTLQAGVAHVVLNVSRSLPPGVPLAGARFADRNVDVLMLHPNATDLAMRLDPATRAVGEVPFDGVLSQVGTMAVCRFVGTPLAVVAPPTPCGKAHNDD